jgi:hypothetical protein
MTWQKEDFLWRICLENGVKFSGFSIVDISAHNAHIEKRDKISVEGGSKIFRSKKLVFYGLIRLKTDVKTPKNSTFFRWPLSFS